MSYGQEIVWDTFYWRAHDNKTVATSELLYVLVNLYFGCFDSVNVPNVSKFVLHNDIAVTAKNDV